MPNLNHFMVMFDYKGEKGYGHVVEEIDDAEEMGTDGELIRGEVGEKGGGKFEKYVSLFLFSSSSSSYAFCLRRS